MSNIGPLVNLWCIVRENRSIFKITIRLGNDLYDLKKAIKEGKPNYFVNADADELVLWRVNVAPDILGNKETAIELYLNEKLENPTNTVGNTFRNVVGNNIRVVVDVPVIVVKTSRRKWTVNGALRETDCSSIEQINGEDSDVFWKSFGVALSIGSENHHFDSCENISGVYDFQKYFGKKTWPGKENDRIVLFIDEFDLLYTFNEKIRSEFLRILRLIKNAMHLFVIHAIVIVGTFSIMHLDSSVSSSGQSLDSPFNVKDLVRNPNFSLDKVRTLFAGYEEENKMKIEDEVIEDIYTQTNGHAGLVCLCGRAIEDNLISKIKGDRILSHGVWVRFKLISLMDEIAQYQTFKRMINSLLDSSAMTAVRFFRDYFLLEDVEHEVKIVDTDSADFLAAEGVLIPVTERAERAFRLSSPMVRNIVLQRVIPKSIIKYACERSFEIAKVRVNSERNQSVPRESVYDSELYRVLWNWLSGFGFQITGQWHLINRNDNNGRNKHSYSDIVITSPRAQVIVLELLATATVGELSEHYNRVLNYARLLSANESWIVHFTCEDDYNEKSHWPSDGLLQQELSVAHFYHDTDFRRVDMTVCWWNNNRNDKSTYKYAVQL
ncbi:hypothetical protein RhiirA1_440353 [Rhizophagus irregularis]|uniref:Uncharacterized protein n=1 Tax=Rhizophagus irregularis TaxID=588596 RepID=A0A2I1DZK3_9GLOM|nr:hypothetical protein RhiirA1_440353 [Rhizophagus irregularis]PKY15274.1 hypothetical protein RhiirB3_466611 [Rhizophagus irregularis]